MSKYTEQKALEERKALENAAKANPTIDSLTKEFQSTCVQIGLGVYNVFTIVEEVLQLCQKAKALNIRASELKQTSPEPEAAKPPELVL
jgi:hypothetical protein